MIYFEGTYTKLFSEAEIATPRYDYNQILYRLSLDRPELNLPVAVYREVVDGKSCFRTARTGATGTDRPVFWALEGPGKGTVPIRCDPDPVGECLLVAGNRANFGDSPVLFYALPPETNPLPPGSIPLYQDDTPENPIALVWEHPTPDGPILPVSRERN